MSAATELTNLAIREIERFGGIGWRQNAGKVPVSYTTKAGQSRKYVINLGRKGLSDALGILPHMLIAAEIKIGEDHLNDDQLRFLLDVVDRGFCSIVVRDELNELTDLLAALTMRRPPEAIAMKATRRYMIKRILTDYYEHTSPGFPVWAYAYEQEVAA